MIRWFWNLVYGSVPAEFQSSYGLDQSVRRLADATGRSVFSALTRQRAVGTVKASKVSLQRVIPFIGNSFKFFFIGQFQNRDGRTVLVGRFTMHWFVKAFMSIWFGFIALWTLFAIAALPFHISKDNWFAPLFGVGMFAAGIALVWVCRWFSRNDVAWLSNVVSSALDGQPPNNRLQDDAP
jgi:hypothetical protein